MAQNQSISQNGSLAFLKQRARDYFKLLKFRLSFLVVFSAVAAFLTAPLAAGVDFSAILALGMGGFLITGASNALNQVIEAEHDRKMTRTMQRPMAEQRLDPTEAVIFALLLATAGVCILGFYFNLVSALLGIIALLLYAFVYTPLKRVSPIGVFVGAFPGSMPLLIGWTAATGELGMGGWILFLIQFIWQFPHFWAIAFIQHEDYSNAGFKMLPAPGGMTKYNATLILIYTALLIPVAILPLGLGMSSWIGFAILALCGVFFTLKAWKLYQNLDRKAALKLMFASFIYLPVVQITLAVENFM